MKTWFLAGLAASALCACSPAAAPDTAAPAVDLGEAQAAAPQPPTLQAVPGANWDVQFADSSIAFSGTHAGNAFVGRFERFNASIRFDPADLANAKVLVVIDTSSARTGNKLQETSLKEGDWFDVAKHPTASFESDRFTQTAPGQFEMAGQLTIKGMAVPVRLPFVLTQTATGATAKGRVELDRIGLKIGVSSDANAEWVSAKIPLDITLVARARSKTGQ